MIVLVFADNRSKRVQTKSLRRFSKLIRDMITEDEDGEIPLPGITLEEFERTYHNDGASDAATLCARIRVSDYLDSSMSDLRDEFTRRLLCDDAVQFFGIKPRRRRQLLQTKRWSSFAGFLDTHTPREDEVPPYLFRLPPGFFEYVAEGLYPMQQMRINRLCWFFNDAVVWKRQTIREKFRAPSYIPQGSTVVGYSASVLFRRKLFEYDGRPMRSIATIMYGQTSRIHVETKGVELKGEMYMRDYQLLGGAMIDDERTRMTLIQKGFVRSEKAYARIDHAPFEFVRWVKIPFEKMAKYPDDRITDPSMSYYAESPEGYRIVQFGDETDVENSVLLISSPSEIDIAEKVYPTRPMTYRDGVFECLSSMFEPEWNALQDSISDLIF